MSQTNYNEIAAFPIDPRGCIDPGMMLIDYFAAKAMEGIQSTFINDAAIMCFGKMAEMTLGESGNQAVARTSYQIAAAMMEERKKYLSPQNSETK